MHVDNLDVQLRKKKRKKNHEGKAFVHLQKLTSQSKSMALWFDVHAYLQHGNMLSK